MRLLGELALRPPRRWWEQRLDRRFDLDTRPDPGALHPAFGVSGPATASFDDAVGYSPVPMHHFRRLMSELPVRDPAEFDFIDLGCGKGRTLVLAAGHGFRRAIGVELDARLASIARDNAAAYTTNTSGQRPDITVVTCDAVDYRFPPVPTVLFLFNPFGADTLNCAVNNLENSMKEIPRPMVVAYFNPVHQDVLDTCSALRPIVSNRHWTIYRTAT